MCCVCTCVCVFVYLEAIVDNTHTHAHTHTHTHTHTCIIAAQALVYGRKNVKYFSVIERFTHLMIKQNQKKSVVKVVVRFTHLIQNVQKNYK